MIDSQAFISSIMEGPGLTAKMLKAIGTIGGGGAITYSDLEQAATLRHHDRVLALRLLDSLCARNVLVSEYGGWRAVVSLEELSRLSLLAEGAKAALVCHKDRDTIKLVITFPGAQGCFMESLRDKGPYYASIVLTDEAFIQTAAKAKFRLVIMTPFLDREGVRIIKRMFTEVPTHVEKILLLRDIPSLNAMGIAGDLAEMRSNGVALVDYLVDTPDGPARYETFHSKIILCDNHTAYIGSANLLASSLTRSFEVGVLIMGKTVEDLGRLIGSILETLKK